jgi:protein O-GlcNAc transferase
MATGSTSDSSATMHVQGERPFWSVIVPIFERQQFLAQCLGSILDQDPGPADLEICVVDDASPSPLADYVRELGRGRVEYVRNSTNLGLYPSTNRAIQKTRGRWLHVLHDDDWVLPGFYATMRRGLESAPATVGVGLCMYANWIVQENAWWSPQPFADRPGVLGRDFVVRLAQACPLNLPAVVYHRETFDRVGLFRDDLPCTADWEWYVRSALQVDWHYQPETLACYRLHVQNQSHALAQVAQNAVDVRRTLELFAEYLPADLLPQVMPAAQEYHAQQFFQTAMECLRNGQEPLARKFALEAMAIDPNGAARPIFANILSHPSFAELRQKLRAFVLKEAANDH